MKKSSSKNKKPIKPNQKISAYFTKIANNSINKNAHTSTSGSNKSSSPKSTKTTSQSPTVICLDDSDDDFVESTPISKRVKHISAVITKKDFPKATLKKGLSLSLTQNSPKNLKVSSEKVLEAITNLPSCSKILDSCVTPSKKRKHSRENTPSPDVIPCSLNTKEQAKFKNCTSIITRLPPRKKAAKESNPVHITNVSDLPQEEFEKLHSPSKNNHDKKPLSPVNSPSIKCRPVEELLDNNLCLTPMKNLFASKDNKTPEKLNKDTPSQQTQNSSGKKTPGKGKKVSPTKLFSKSPKSLHKFNVEIIENFVKITPSKSDRNNEPSASCASPNVSTRSIEIQLQNERTPPKSPKENHSSLQALRVKMRLDFGSDEHQDVKTICSINENTDVVKDGLENSLKSEEKPPSDNNIDSMLNDSWDADLDIVDNVEAVHTLDLTESKHCKVLKIHRSFHEMSFIAQSTKDGATAICAVEGFWLDTKLAENDTVHITAVYDKTKSAWCVDNNNGLIVFEPDFLISTTSVVGAVFCKRRSVLNERYRGFEPSNRIMIIGILVHKLLQEVLKKNVLLYSEIEVIAKKLMIEKDTIWMCYESSLQFDDVEREILEFVPRIVSFMNCYVKQPKNGSLAQNINKDDWKGKIDSVQDIEENIWCTELGVKGKVDVSIKSGMTTMPLELKTGRATVSLEHRGQVILYIMMMNKFGYTVPSGLLLYLREGVLREIPITAKEKRDLIILRNELTYYLTRKPTLASASSSDVPAQKSNGNQIYASSSKCSQEPLLHSELPEPINHHNACSKCPYNTICCTYLKFEHFNLSNSPLKNLQKEVLEHLEPQHLKYFIDWSSLLTLEASNNGGQKQLREIYTVPPEKREKNGQCIIRVQVKEVSSECGGLFKHTFEKMSEEDLHVNLLLSGIGVGNYVVVSTDARPAVSAGFVTHMDYQTITIDLDRNLNKRYNKSIFHLDTYSSSTSQTFNMTNLALLLEASEQAKKLRNIVIDKQPPTFVDKLPKSVAIKGTPILRTLNKMQQKAILKSLSTNDYLLIKGMPGTGKTATIVALVQILVELNKTVLITSHTHAAVDNVCVRLQACGIGVLRLGAESRIHSKLRSCSEHVLTQHCNTPEQLEEVYSGAQILAVTCLGSGHSVLSKRQLDVCIVDESTQVLQCSVFRALYTARKFILIGDPDQLPPVIKSREAIIRGLSESLFERLDCPTATVMLTLNYRMNKPITAMANALTYEGHLLIANDEVGNATVCFPDKEKFLTSYQDRPWITKVLDDSLSSSIKILDTGPTWERSSTLAEQEVVGDLPSDKAIRCINLYEIAIVVTLVDALLEAGLCGSTIGVIAPYRAQVSKISEALKGKEIEISTVDQFQGRDKEVMIYSCTKSCNVIKSRSETEFEILEDKRRLTVAITRAKHKFILIGDLATMRQYSPFHKLLSCLEAECFMRLQDDHLGFKWDKVMTSISSEKSTQS